MSDLYPEYKPLKALEEEEEEEQEEEEEKKDQTKAQDILKPEQRKAL